MKRVDREALERAIKLAREQDAGRRQQIDGKLKSESWEAVGRFASYFCQSRSLKLRPWQWPPCWVTIDDQDDGLGGRKAAAMLLRRLLDAGLSKFEPDPLNAISEAEAKTARP